jgi:hypothetical protein
LRIIFQVYAALSLLVGGLHFIGIFYPINSSPTWRHTLFVGINLFSAYGFLKRPRFFVYLFFLLLLQQIYSHGGNAIAIWNQQHVVSWIDVIVLIFTALAFALLLIDKKQSS